MKKQNSGKKTSTINKDNFIETKNLMWMPKKNKKVLSDISFNVAFGSIHGLIGPNGAGKTSLIKILLSAFFLNKGLVKINKNPIKNNDWKKNLGYIPESCKYSLNKKVKNVLRESANLSMLSNNWLNKKINLFSEKYINIKNYLDHRVKNLSSGEQKLIMIFDAWMKDPLYLILDEPTENLDPTHRNIFFKIITDFMSVNKESKAVLISSHILSELNKICDEVTFISSGVTKATTPIKGKNSLEKMYLKYLGE